MKCGGRRRALATVGKRDDAVSKEAFLADERDRAASPVRLRRVLSVQARLPEEARDRREAVEEAGFDPMLAPTAIPSHLTQTVCRVGNPMTVGLRNEGKF